MTRGFHNTRLDNYDWERLADAVRAELNRRHWTQGELAHRARTSQNMISSIANANHGRGYTRLPASLAGLDDAFGWPPGTSRKIAAGEVTPS